MAQKNYYIVLGLTQKASLEDIKKAYRQLAFRYHPDHYRGGKTGEERFREIKEAYEKLADPQQRKIHDADLRSRHVYAPSYDFGKYTQANPNAPKHPNDFTTMQNEESDQQPEPIRPWYMYVIKPVIFLLIALLLMKLITSPPLWLKNWLQ